MGSGFSAAAATFAVGPPLAYVPYMIQRFICAALAGLLILFVAMFFLYVPILKLAALMIVLLALVLTFVLGIYVGNPGKRETVVANQ